MSQLSTNELIQEAFKLSDETSSLFDPHQAIKLLQQAMSYGDGMAAYYLGVGMMNGVYGLAIEQATEYFQTAIDLDCAYGYFGLGKRYFEEGKNLELALEYFDKGAINKHFGCAKRLYEIHLEGKDVKPDTNYIIDVMMPFVQDKNMEAIFYIAHLYGLTNDERAIDYWLQAGVSGINQAWLELSLYYQRMDEVQDALHYALIGIGYCTHTDDLMLLAYFEDLKMALIPLCDDHQRKEAQVFVDHFFDVIEEVTKIKIQHTRAV